MYIYLTIYELFYLSFKHKPLNLPGLLLSELKTWFEDFFKIPGAKEGNFGGSIGFVWASLLGEEVFSLLVKIG